VAFHIRDAEADSAVRELAARKGLSLTDAVKQAAQNELRLMDQDVPFLERIRDIQRQAAAYPRTGLKADKAFYDDLSGDI
jgi:antitoxin VapB